MPMRLYMPRFGEIMESGLLTRWLVEDGSTVAQGEPIYEVETSKTQVVVESPAAGTLQRRIAAGTEVPVGVEVGVLLLPGEPSGG